MKLDEILKSVNKTVDDIEDIYHGKDNWCRQFISNNFEKALDKLCSKVYNGGVKREDPKTINIKRRKRIMANWCSTVYVFYGENKEGIDNLFNDLKEVEEKDNTWIGNVFMKKGFTEKEAEELVYRSFITSVCRYKTGEVELTCEDAWNYHYEEMRELIDKYGEGIHFEMLAEECGNGIFVNTDEGGVYFTDRFMIDCDIDGTCFNEYFPNETGLREYLVELFKDELKDSIDISSMKLSDIQDYFNDTYKDRAYLYINEFDTEI